MRMFSLILALFLPLLSYAKEEKRPTICLNMIVKNESRVITRCLESVKPVIDYWVIVDTGSKDGTQKIIKKFMKGIPGKLYERPWKNWGETRTEALKLAQKDGKECDYILFMDADDILQFDDKIEFPLLKADLYNLWRGSKDFTYLKPQLAKLHLPWKWVGVTHEYLGCDTTFSSDLLHGVKYVTLDGGACSYDPQKFWKNVHLLEEGLKKEPDNARYAFYLAESYRDAGEKGKALEWYQRRIKMGGWDEEIFWSKLQIALLLSYIGLPSKIVAEAYLDAHHFRPHRLEPLYYLAELYNNLNEFSKAYEYLKSIDFIAKPAEKDGLFNMDWIEDYGILFQLSICSHYAGNYEESLATCDRLLKVEDLPEGWRAQTVINRKFPLEKLQAKKGE
jgi:glycosyltransferase involved in cell wall biosynthesis